MKNQPNVDVNAELRKYRLLNLYDHLNTSLEDLMAEDLTVRERIIQDRLWLSKTTVQDMLTSEGIEWENG